MLSAVLGLSASPVLAQSTDPIKEAFAGCGVITFDTNAQGFRTASTFDNRSVNNGPFNAPYVSGSNRFQWEATGGHPDGHLRADDMDGQWQEVWTPILTDPDFSVLNGQQLQFDYRNDTGYNQYRLYIAIVGTNGSQYYYYFNDQLGSPGTWSRVKVPMVASAWHTGFEANENPTSSGPPNTPAPSAANFAAVLSSLSRIAISVEGVQGADTSRFDNFGRACDWGDLPESGTSFATTGTNNGARHNISDAIRLGALIDPEPDGQPTTAANGDDTNNPNNNPSDEDGLASLPPLPITTASYSLQVAVTNITGNPATLYGWIDWDGNNSFEPAEIQTATVSGNGSATSATLTWTGVRVSPGTTRYARLRFTTFPLNDDVNTPADERARGIASDGEVEDYLLSAAPLGSLTVIKNAVGGNDSFSFNATGLLPFTLSTTNGTAQRTFTGLLPGNYSVTELLSPAWDLTSATCTGGKDPNSFLLALSENVTCTFANTKRASLTIIKNTLYGNGTFDFVSQALNAFSLTTVNGTAQQTFDLLAPGTYDVSEAVPNGWRLDSATCDDGSNPASVNLAAGEDVTCTFNDTKLNSIIAIKATVGGDDTFPFVSQTLGNFSLTTVNGLAQSSFNDLPAGTYDLSEMVPASWTLSSATCSDGSDPANIQLSPGETVACVFIDLKQNTIVVEKHAVGGDDRFGFTGSPSIGAFALNTTNGVASQSFGGLLAGTYAINETVPTGWRQTGATCDNGNSPSNIQLAPGQTVKCTFENEKQDTIIVVKRAVGGDGTFPFVSQTLGNFNLKTVKGEAQKSFTNLRPGIYDLSETVPAGWTLSGTPTCSDGSPVNHIDLRAGETVTCVFIDLKQNTIIVEKQTQGGDGAFAFASSNPQIGNFTLTTNNGVASQSFTGLPAGTYNIAETVPAGWRQTGATCDNGNSPSNVQLVPGQTVKCTFANEKQNTITVVKRAVGGDGTFPFVSQSLGNFNLKTAQGAAKRNFSNLTPGTYDLSETVPAGWTLSTATCDNGDAPGSIHLVSGQTVVCTFENTKQDTIIVAKHAVGGDGAFDFVSRSLGNFILTTTNGEAQNSFGNLAPGTYDLSETVPTGWNLSTATCSNGSSPASVQLSAGQTVTCTFTNLKQNSIVVEQQTRGGDGTFAFTSPQLSSFGLTTRSGVASQAFAALSTGLYAISQTLPSGWTLVSATCDNGDPPDRINLGSGQSVKCTFVGQFQGVSSSDIPTLSEWGLLLLGALLAFGAWWQERIRTATGYW
ncbi:MAG: IPTL-CTERM sorting domain-containing protein [Candidatus Competibacter sp.]